MPDVDLSTRPETQDARAPPAGVGRGFVQDAWYVAALSSELKAGALARYELLGEPVLLGRDRTGAVFALRDICPHRAAPLSAGRLVDDAAGAYPAIALDAAKRPVDTVTSNLGHLLGTGLLTVALGLLAFGYAALHFLIYLFDHGFSLAVMFEDVLKRPFVTVGFTALLLLVPLALTSGKNAVKRLGFQKWTRLHQLVYLSVALGALHYYWGVKQDHTPPLIYAGVIAALFAVRFLKRRPTKKQGGPEKTSPA